MRTFFEQTYLKTEPQPGADAYIFLVDDMQTCEAITGQNFKAVCVTQQDTQNPQAYTTDTFLEYMHSILTKGTFASNYTYVCCGARAQAAALKEGIENCFVTAAVETDGNKLFYKKAFLKNPGHEEELKKALQEYVNQHEGLDLAPLTPEAYKDKYSAANMRAAFEAETIENKTAGTYATGFCNLNEALNGGFKKGLYFVGGISSIGKTSFIMQLADNLAAAGNDVLMIALEMSSHELIAKSISRQTYLDTFPECHEAQTTNSILFADYPEAHTLTVEIAKDKYFAKIAPHIFIIEGVGSVGTDSIRAAVEAHEKATGRKPIVFVDYLQILAPADVRATDKQNIDKAVLELKRLSRDKGIPVIAISSFNRENYTQAVSMTSFKESGAVEYTSDVLIGLQFAGMDRTQGESDKDYTSRVLALRKEEEAAAGNGQPQHIEIKVLKNRNGKKGVVYLDFIPKYNYFYEVNPFSKHPQPSTRKVQFPEIRHVTL